MEKQFISVIRSSFLFILATAASSVALVLFSPTARAAPAISSVTGTLSNSGAVTITGSGFGATGPSVRLFDNFESGSNGAFISTLTSTAGHFSNVWTTTTGGNSPAYSTAFAHSGTKAAKINFQGGTQIEGNTMGVSFSSASEWLMSFWVYVPVGKDVPGTNNPDGPNWKLWWSTAGGAGSETADYVDVILSNDLSSELWEPADDPQNGSATGCPWYNTIGQKGRWLRKTWYFNGSTSGSGILWLSEVDGTQQTAPCNVSNATTTYGPLTNFIQIPGYGRTDSNAEAYYDDIYIATGAGARARVEIGNASTYGGSTNLALLVPSSWSDTSIAATVYSGSLAAGQAYLYVVDANGQVNANGFPVTLSSGGGGSCTP